jgi:hypothetical protein
LQWTMQNIYIYKFKLDLNCYCMLYVLCCCQLVIICYNLHSRQGFLFCNKVIIIKAHITQISFLLSNYQVHMQISYIFVYYFSWNCFISPQHNRFKFSPFKRAMPLKCNKNERDMTELWPVLIKKKTTLCSMFNLAF